MGALCAVSAILTATAGLDAEQRTTLHRFATPMFQMNGTRLRNQIKERLMIEGAQCFDIHRRMVGDSATSLGMTRAALLKSRIKPQTSNISSPIYRLRM